MCEHSSRVMLEVVPPACLQKSLAYQVGNLPSDIDPEGICHAHSLNSVE